jgi:hypothetical protein
MYIEVPLIAFPFFSQWIKEQQKIALEIFLFPFEMES